MHRAVFNFMINHLAATVAYSLKPKKLSLNSQRAFMLKLHRIFIEY